jgi:hypothetical protein
VISKYTVLVILGFPERIQNMSYCFIEYFFLPLWTAATTLKIDPHGLFKKKSSVLKTLGKWKKRTKMGKTELISIVFLFPHIFV